MNFLRPENPANDVQRTLNSIRARQTDHVRKVFKQHARLMRREDASGATDTIDVGVTIMQTGRPFAPYLHPGPLA